MSVSQRGNNWQAYVCRGGKRFRMDTPDETQARVWEAAILEALQEGREPNLEEIRGMKTSPAQQTFREFSEGLFKVIWGGTKGERTARINLNAVQEFFGDRTLASLTHDDVDGFVGWLIDECGNSNGTVNRKLA